MADIVQPAEEKTAPSRSKISLVKSFSPTNYPSTFHVEFDIASFFVTPNADKLFRGEYYPVFKRMMYEQSVVERMAQKEREFREGFAALGIDDYCVYIDGRSASLHFRNSTDMMKAASIVIPEHVFDVEFLTYPDDVPAKYLAAKAKQIQTLYDDSDPAEIKLTQRPLLQPDFEHHRIKATTKAIDIPVILEHAEKFLQHFNAV